uniref:Hexosyltransferase n=1 Tax=Phallusia mammillata TaxID=59560 RepID=A0A6F9D7W5_9ASCI|nr:lactosylceramide 1,3-N-acetyl-beta-D-glucosaminyltransferase-like [Phallusia mammillata]
MSKQFTKPAGLVLSAFFMLYFVLWKLDATILGWEPNTEDYLEKPCSIWHDNVSSTNKTLSTKYIVPSSRTSGLRSLERYLWDGPRSNSDFKTVPPLFEVNHNARNITDSWLLKPNLTTTSDRYFMVIVVKSAVKLRRRRQMIRDTWGSVNTINGKRFAVVFVVGKVTNETLQNEIALESQQYNDIIQSEVSDDYSALPDKVLSAFQWVTFDLQNVADFYGFTDDDCVINLPLTYDYFSTNQEEFIKSNAMHCAFMYSAAIGPERSGRYAVSTKTYPWGRLPPFCHGGFTVLPQQLMVDIYQQAQVTKRYDMHLEDVYILGILRTKLGRGNDNIKIAYADGKRGQIGFYMGPFVWHLGHNTTLFRSAWRVVFNLMQVTTNQYKHEGSWPSSQLVRAEFNNRVEVPQDLDTDEFFSKNFAGLLDKPPVDLECS